MKALKEVVCSVYIALVHSANAYGALGSIAQSLC